MGPAPVLAALSGGTFLWLSPYSGPVPTVKADPHKATTRMWQQLCWQLGLLPRLRRVQVVNSDGVDSRGTGDGCSQEAARGVRSG